MPLPKAKRDRVHQVTNWLRSAHPAPYPADVRVIRIPQEDAINTLGDCVLYRRKFMIRISPAANWVNMIDTLLHEWAHALAWPRSSEAHRHPDHSDEWALSYGRLFRSFHEEDGAEDSQNYPW